MVYPHNGILFGHKREWNLSTTWVNLENVMLSERIQTQKCHILYSSSWCGMRKIGISMVTESKLISGCQGIGDKGNREYLLNGYWVSLWGDEEVLEQIVLMIARHCEYAKNHWIMQFEKQWILWCVRGFPGGSVVKNSLANAEDSRDPGSIPGREDPLEEKMATYSSIFAWRIPWAEKPGRL